MEKQDVFIDSTDSDNASIRSDSSEENFCLKTEDFQGCFDTSSEASNTPLNDDDGKFLSESAMALAKNLTELYNDEILTDVDVIVGDRTFHCHKIVLCAVSNYFRSMFTSGMVESSSRATTLHSVTPECFQAILNYIYRGADIFNEESVAEFLEASVVLQMRGLETCCIEFMASSLNPRNSINVWELCRRHNCEDIADRAWKMSVTQFEQVMAKTDLLELKEEILVKLLSDKKLKFSDEDVLCQAIFDWIEADSDTRTNSLTYLMNYVCLPEVSGDFLFKNLYKNKLVTNVPVLAELVDDAIKCHLIPDEKPSVLLKQKTIRNTQQFRRALVVIGGNITDGESLNNMSCWDEVSNSWYTLSSLPYHMGEDFASCVLNNKIYVSGGSEAHNSVVCYDPAQNCWSSLPNLCHGRELHSMVGVDDSLYVLGGRNDKQNATEKMVGNIEMLCLGSSKWITVGEMAPIVESCAVGVIGHKIFIYGGMDEFALSKRISSFDVNTKVYTNIVEMDTAYKGLRSVQIQHDNVFLMSDTGHVLNHAGDDQLNHLFHIPGFDRNGFALTSDGVSIIIIGGKRDNERLDSIQSLCIEDHCLTQMASLGIPIDALQAHSIVIPADFLLQKGMSIGDTSPFPPHVTHPRKGSKLSLKLQGSLGIQYRK